MPTETSSSPRHILTVEESNWEVGITENNWVLTLSYTDGLLPSSGLTTQFSTAKTTPVNADRIAIFDSAASFAPKHTLWSSIKATLKSYFDTLYAALVHTHVTADILDATSGALDDSSQNLIAKFDPNGNLLINTVGTNSIDVYPNGIINLASTNVGGVVVLSGELATDARNIAFPDASGTVALTSDITDAVTSNTTSDGTCDLTLSTLVVGVSTASGVKSVAIGQSTASGNLSFASGLSSATNDYSFASGDGSIASGYASFAANNSVASGDQSASFGSATTASGVCSFAAGINSTASGSASMTVGNGCESSGDGSFSAGAETNASAEYAFAIGSSTTASGIASFSSGDSTVSSNNGSFAIGLATEASGIFSFAGGSYSTASGENAYAFGYRAKALHNGSSVESDYQDADVESTTTDEKTFRFLNGYRFLGGSATFDGTVFANHIHGNIAGNVYTHVRAGEALTKGDPVYVSGSHGSGSTLIPIVSKADASNAAKMPAVGIVDADIANNASGHMVIVGTITELNTNAYAINDTLYVASGGGWTSTPPAANSQPVARVERSNTNNGAVIVKVNGLASSGGNGVSDANKLVRFGSTGTIPVASIGGLGTGVATALGNTANGTGGVVTTNGIATLSNKVLSNCTGYNYTDLSGIQRAIRTSNFSRPVGTYTTAQQADQVLTLNLLANVTYRVKIFAQFVGTGGSQVAGGISAPNSQFATLLVKRSGSFVGQAINTINPWSTFGILATTVNTNQLVEVDYIIKPLVNGATSILWNPFAGTGEVSIIAGSYIQAEIIG